MSKIVKKMKIMQPGGTLSDYVSIGAEAENINVDGESVKTKLGKKPYYYDTVADMKADTKLKAGDMAVTLGYYEVNDGGRAEYKIVSIVDQNEYKESLANQLFAILILNEYITYKQFGALLNGIDDDTNFVINAHNFANKYNLKIVQNNGILFLKTANINNCPIIKTSCDFTGMTIKITEEQEQNRLMFISHDNEQRIELEQVQINELVNNTGTIDFLKQYPNSLISFTYTDLSIGTRPIGTPYEMFYSECCLTDRNGNLIDGKLFKSLNEASQVTMFVSSLNERSIEIKGLNFEIDTISSDYIPNIEVDRNNISITDVNVKIKKLNTSNITTYKGSLLIFRRCYNYILSNVNAENLSDYLSSGVTKTQTTYFATSNLCHSCKIINSTIIRG